MVQRIAWAGLVAATCLLNFGRDARSARAAEAAPGARAQVRVDYGHPWRAPFGLQRVGRPLGAIVEFAPGHVPPEAWLVGYRDGKEIARHRVAAEGKDPRVRRASFAVWPDELRLLAPAASGGLGEWARQAVRVPAFEAEAAARPDAVVNPVDLGAILVPSDWLLLAGGQGGTIEVAAVSRAADVPGARAVAWFESSPGKTTTAEAPLVRDRRATAAMRLPPAPTALDRDTLYVSLVDAGGKELWRKKTPTMLVRNPPKWPAFGAARTMLRYDAPISVRADDGKLSSIDYAAAWDAALDDVVVSLPNGSRFVFWRGSSYVPFWAGRHNTGLSYEWAETSPPADGYTDCVEPLMDKELRYGRVRIVESTPARVHLRWAYQSCDFKYKVWGDSAAEDFYFYPDGFGTRALTLQSDPKGDYELSEFIILTPQATHPFSVLPPNLVDILFLDGQKREISFPFLPEEQGEKMKPRGMPAVYRVRLHRDEPLAAVYFNPLDKQLPPAVFAPFRDQGQIVTPTYWGSHWPLARGKTTGWAIDDRIHLTPCHNSVMSWSRSRPAPVRTARVETLDTLGRSRPMIVQTWVWLIGMTDAPDERLLDWAKSFSAPPSIELQGARLDAEPYVPERRAIRLVAKDPSVTIRIKPAARCVNPVFEFAGPPRELAGVTISGRPLDPSQFAWDGHTLWLGVTIGEATEVRVDFRAAGNPVLHTAQ